MLAWVLDTTTTGVKKLAHAWDGPWRIVEKPHPDILILEDVKDKKKRVRRHREAVQRCWRPDEAQVDEFPKLQASKVPDLVDLSEDYVMMAEPIQAAREAVVVARGGVMDAPANLSKRRLRGW